MSGGAREVRVPDIGTDEKVDVVEILVAVGDRVAVDDGLVTLESDKASMDVPAPFAGTVEAIRVKAGDRVGEGDLLLTVSAAEGERAEDEEPGDEPAAEPEEERPAGGEEETAADGRDDVAPPGRQPSAAAGEPESRPAGGPAAAAERVDLVVLGAGPGGYTAAFRAADLGLRVVLVERHATLGGVCLNVGCIPSKALLHVARVIDEAADLGEHGVAFGEPRLDLDKLRSWKESVVGRLTGGLSQMAGKRGVRVVRGTARLTGPHELTVAGEDGETTLGFEQAILAAGSRPATLPGLPADDPRIMDSTAALELAEIPNRLLVVGGGIIGLEMATVYAALGSRLTVVELLDGLMPGCDRDLVRPLERRLGQRYDAAIHVGTKVDGVKGQKNGLKVTFAGDGAPEPALFDRLLVAVGRRPNSDRLGLQAAGLEPDERGFLPVDAQQRTRVPHIFAIGDLVPGPMLAHKASHEGKVAAEVAAGEKSGFDARAIPSVAYTDPEVAWVGLTETAAKENGTAYEVGRFPWAASGRALGMGRGDGLTKILFDPETRRILGAGVVGPSAGDLIAELTLAIEMDCEAADLGLTIHAHPTLSETVAFAAEVFEGTVTDLYLPRKRR